MVTTNLQMTIPPVGESGPTYATEIIDAFSRIDAAAPLSVKAYGAIGNGTTDDAAAIQSAISAAVTAGGGTVYFPPGTYLVQTRISLKDRVSLMGAGREYTTLKAGTSVASSTGVLTGLSADTVSDVTIRALQIDGNASGITNTVRGIQITAGARVRLVEVYIHDTKDAAIQYDSTPDAIIDHCYIKNAGVGAANGYGINFVNASHRAQITTNLIDQMGVMGVRIDASTDGLIAHNTILGVVGSVGGAGNGVEPIGLTSTATRTRVIANNVTDGGDNGISVTASQCLVVGNTVQKARFYGVQCTGSNNIVADNTIKNCGQVNDGTRAGVLVSTSAGAGLTNVVANNRIFDDQGSPTQDHGVRYSTGNETSNVLIGNQLEGNKTGAVGGTVPTDLMATANRGYEFTPSKPVVWNVHRDISTMTFSATNQFRGTFVTVPIAMKVNRLRIRVATQSGNISGAIYNAAGTTRLATTGAIACPATNNQELALTAEVTLQAGVYFVGLSADNTSATFHGNGTAQIYGGALTATAHPAPTTVTVDDQSAGIVPLVGLSHS